MRSRDGAGVEGDVSGQRHSCAPWWPDGEGEQVILPRGMRSRRVIHNGQRRTVRDRCTDVWGANTRRRRRGAAV